MTFLVRPGVPFYRAQLRARSLDGWRRAERLVSMRWDAFVVADRQGRSDAFAAYVVALDAEQAAAAKLAGLCLDGAA